MTVWIPLLTFTACLTALIDDSSLNRSLGGKNTLHYVSPLVKAVFDLGLPDRITGEICGGGNGLDDWFHCRSLLLAERGSSAIWYVLPGTIISDTTSWERSATDDQRSTPMRTTTVLRW
jgi:hypothetical protein